MKHKYVWEKQGFTRIYLYNYNYIYINIHIWSINMCEKSKALLIYI